MSAEFEMAAKLISVPKKIKKTLRVDFTRIIVETTTRKVFFIHKRVVK
jgi:hypothetical protein